MLGFCVINCLPPAAPEEFVVRTPNGSWKWKPIDGFEENKKAMLEGKVAETYYLTAQLPKDANSAQKDATLDELTPLLLAVSYALGLSVTVVRSIQSSECMIISPSSHWPRQRAMGEGSPIVFDVQQLTSLAEQFVEGWPSLGQQEKARLLIHHWIDALACWSLEDLYLSAMTLLEIIRATEEKRQNKTKTFCTSIDNAVARFGIAKLPKDVRDMRNDLIHDGHLSASHFPGKSVMECAQVAVQAMNWIDEYLFAALKLGAITKPRFGPMSFAQLNSFSVD